MHSYEEACQHATIAQGLEPFALADGWTVEQTGGFTMVAVRHMPDGTVWTVTRDGSDEAPYYAVHSTREAWVECLDVEPLAKRYLTLDEVLNV